MSFPSIDSAYEKISRIQGRNDAVEPMQVWLAKVKDNNQDVVLKIFDLNHRNADFLETIQVVTGDSNSQDFCVCPAHQLTLALGFLTCLCDDNTSVTE